MPIFHATSTCSCLPPPALSCIPHTRILPLVHTCTRPLVHVHALACWHSYTCTLLLDGTLTHARSCLLALAHVQALARGTRTRARSCSMVILHMHALAYLHWHTCKLLLAGTCTCARSCSLALLHALAYLHLHTCKLLPSDTCTLMLIHSCTLPCTHLDTPAHSLHTSPLAPVLCGVVLCSLKGSNRHVKQNWASCTGHPARSCAVRLLRSPLKHIFILLPTHIYIHTYAIIQTCTRTHLHFLRSQTAQAA